MDREPVAGQVIAVARNAAHTFSKQVVAEIALLAEWGVEGDAHAGRTVQHLYKVRKDPKAANLCQVHLLQSELFAELADHGMTLAPGEIGENVTTVGLDLLGLGEGTCLHLGESAVIEVTGLRTPCTQMNGLRPGLMKACTAKSADGRMIRKAGIMGIVRAAGIVRAGDAIRVQVPAGKLRPLRPV